MNALGENVAVVEEKIITKNKAKLTFSWHQKCFAGILFLSACLNLLLLDFNSYTNQYYASAVRSMLASWHNFFYNSFDPGGFITVDKPPVALWLQTISAWLFGYNGVTILLPSALAGVGSVALLYNMVKRGFGPVAGLIAAFALAITPIMVVMNRHNNPESLLIFFMLLGAWALSQAVAKGRLAWLVLAFAMMGVAFNVKMLEAFIILPTFYALYLLLARVKWWKRPLHLLAATAVLAVISLSWAVMVDLTPASQRPYIGSSSDNTVMNLIFNYNGLNRIEGQNFGGSGNNNRTGNPPGGLQQNSGTQQNGSSSGGFQQNGNPPGGAPSNNGLQFPNRGQQDGNNRPDGGGFGGGGGGMNGVIAGKAGAFRMFDQSLAGEAGWLLPLALIGMVLVAIQTWFRFPTWKERVTRYQGLLLWSGWLMTFMVVFSMAEGTFHSYYLVMLSPGIAALSGIGFEALWHSYRRGGWQKWLLPVVLVITAIFQFNLLSVYSDWNRTLALVMLGLELVCATALLTVPSLLRSTGPKWTRWIATVGFLGLCAAPAAWAISAIVKKSYTNETLPTAVPVGASVTSSFGFNRQENNNILLSNLVNSWNVWLTVLVIGLLALVGLGVALRFVRQLKGQLHLKQFSTLAAAAVVICLGISLAFTCLPPAKASASNAQPVSSGQIGNPQMTLNDNAKLIAYLQANQNGYTYLLATSNSNNAAPIIIKTGQPVMALGGFQGNDNTVTAQQFAQMVKDKVVRYVLLDSTGGFGRMGGGQSATSWVQQSCKVVDSSLWSSTTSSSTTSRSGFGGSSSGQLYDCATQK
jgi:4-amino-4-deoxy-L-arabinose transferase-like glycosyltransferase